jgi:hypothetical protein
MAMTSRSHVPPRHPDEQQALSLRAAIASSSPVRSADGAPVKLLHELRGPVREFGRRQIFFVYAPRQYARLFATLALNIVLPRNFNVRNDIQGMFGAALLCFANVAHFIFG